MKRRQFLTNTTTALAGTLLAPKAAFSQNVLFNSIDERIKQKITTPVIIEKIELLLTQKLTFLRVYAKDGAIGTTMCNNRMDNLYSLLKGLIIPFYMGKDARDIVTLSEDIFLDERNYKYGGMPFWNCAGSVEIAIWDMLGRIANCPIHQFFGTQQRQTLPMYLSSLTRETTAEHEINYLLEKLQQTGSQAVKIKVGGRMKNTPEAEDRTQAIVPLARKLLGDHVAIYADANGSYTSEDGIRIASLLEDYGVAVFEEPCAWEDYAGNRRVKQGLKKMKLAGGEQDTSYYRFKEIVETNVYDVLQPDLYYNGGILRALKVDALATEYSKLFAPHSPKADPLFAPFAQVMAITQNMYGFQEFPANRVGANPTNWYAPQINVVDGKTDIPNGSGLGITYDETIFDKAERL